MKTIKILPVLILISGVFLTLSAWCDEAPPAPADDNFKYVKHYVDDVVADDGTEETHYTLSFKVLREDAIKNLKEFDISYSTSAEKVEVKEAWTQKPDGKRIDSPKDNFQLTVSGGRQGANPAFSDQSSLTIVFPDVAVGDTLNVVYTRKIIAPLFPKQFSHWHYYPKTVVYDDARLSYSIPLSLKARWKNMGMKETVNKQENQRQLLEWTYSNPTSDKRAGHSVQLVERIDDDPGVVVSTFPSYRTIAESYGERAKPKAAVTDQIRKLAEEITKDKKTPREQVRALYEWEIKHITYAGNCIGIGAVVPRDLDFVLTNKMGDCKDHATLLQALLAAKDIESTQALIGVNAMYDLPDIPVVSTTNHVINYIPSMDIYLDATSEMPFGILPSSIAGKPVLLVDGYKDGTKTPAIKPGFRRHKTTADMTITEDGSIEGKISIQLAGESAHAAHENMKDVTSQALERMNEGMLKQTGYQGKVDFHPGAWDEEKMTYGYEISFKLNEYVYPGTPGALFTAPPFAPQSIARSMSGPLAEKVSQQKEKLARDFLCGNIVLEENYKYTFPKNMNVLAVPDNVTAVTEVQKYTAQYSHEGKTVTVTRKLDDTTPGPTCKPEIENEYEQIAAKAMRDMKAQIVYK